MGDYAGKVWNWYLKRSLWSKIFLFVFVVVAIIIVGMLSWFFYGSKLPDIPDPDQIKLLSDNAEDTCDENLKETKKMDSEFAKRILGEEEKRNEIENERKRLLREAKKVHEEIDNFSDFDSIDRTVDEYIKRAVENKRRRPRTGGTDDV